MRILMTTDAVGGVWTYTAELCRALARYGCAIDLGCLGGAAGEARRREIAGLRNVRLHESDYRLEWMADAWADVARSAAWLASLQRQTGADLVHLNCYGPAAASFDVPLLLVTHSCVHTWWRATRGTDPEPTADWLRYRNCVMHALCTADRVVAPTSASLAATDECYEEVNLNGRAQVIHNGVDVGRWNAARLPSGRFVLAAGRFWDDAKNLRQLVAIAPALPCPVMIAGEGKLGAAAEAPGVVPLGPLPRADLVPWYRRAAVFAHPARYEPFGLAVLEAALAGCPLVLGDIPTLRELWNDVAVFVDPDDTEAWRSTLARLLADTEERRRRGLLARERALRYGASRMASGYAACYRQLIGLRAEDVA